MYDRFWTSRLPENDFTEKLSGRKILKFPHCDFISLESFSYSHSTRHLNFFLKKLCRVLRVRLFDHYILETLLEDMLEMKNFFRKKMRVLSGLKNECPCFERPKISCSLVIVLFFQVYFLSRKKCRNIDRSFFKFYESNTDPLEWRAL